MIGQSTKSIREAQESIVNLSKTRTEAVLYARENGVSYQVLATAMGTSEQTVYKIVKPYLKKKEQADDL
jgi:DNA-directed RNA polymerase specialized sigma24 family protein